ncbi:MAG: insulinase family protein, partial [Acidobacteriota bacterium]|nr:insulinase family protein [Acidobacteriota bacterium]
KDVQDFFRINYAPNNAVLVISGAFEPAQAKELVSKYFATIPKQPKPPAVDVAEPSEVAMKYKQFEDKLAPFPAFILGWKIPQRQTPEHEAISLAGRLISEGESSRLYQKLVKGEESVLQLVSFTDERRGPSSFLIFAIPKPGRDLSKIRETIMNEIKDMATNGPTAEEMQKLHNQLINGAVRSRQSSLSRAQAIAEYALYDGDPTLVNTELEKLLSITPAQIKDAVSKYLNTENRVLLDIVPAGKKTAAPKEGVGK